MFAPVALVGLSLLGCSGIASPAPGDDEVARVATAGSEAELIAILVDEEQKYDDRCEAVMALGDSGTAAALQPLGWVWGFSRLPCSTIEVPTMMQRICTRERSSTSWCQTVTAVATPLPCICSQEHSAQRGQYDVIGQAPSLRVSVVRTATDSSGPRSPRSEPPAGQRVHRLTVGPVAEHDVARAGMYAAALTWAVLSDQLAVDGFPEAAREAAEAGNDELMPRVVPRPEDIPKLTQEIWRARTALGVPSTRQQAGVELRALLGRRLAQIGRQHPEWRVQE